MNDNQKSTTVKSGVGFFTILFFVFLVLKLTGFISWSWWWVTAPLWAPTVIGLAIAGIFLLIGVIISVTHDARKARKIKRHNEEQDRLNINRAVFNDAPAERVVEPKVPRSKRAAQADNWDDEELW